MFLRWTLVVVCLATLSSADEMPIEAGKNGNSIGFLAFNRVMRTEIVEEFGLRRLSTLESSSLWDEAIKKQWKVAEETELAARDAGSGSGRVPFLVCDQRYAMPGADAARTVREDLSCDEMVVSHTVGIAVEFLVLMTCLLPKYRQCTTK